jgi:hypothetical protein
MGKTRSDNLDAMMTDVQVGALTSGLATLPTMVQGLFGRTLGALVYAATTVIGGSIIGLCYAPRTSFSHTHDPTHPG